MSLGDANRAADRAALTAVLAASPFPIITYDASGRVEAWSPAAERLFGWSAAEAAGQPLPPVPDEYADEAQALRTRVLAGQRVSGVETVRRARTGTLVLVNVSLEPIAGGATVTGYVAVFDDIGPRKQTDLAVMRAARIQATAKLAGGVAHDVNNLMAGVLGNAELLRSDLADRPDVQPALADIAEAAVRAGALGQQLLAYARAGRYHPEPIDLNTIAAETIAAASAERNRLPILRHTLADDLWTVEGDRAQMTQLVFHLIQNALDATVEFGMVVLRTKNVELSDDWARARPGARSGPHVHLSVEDTGAGMDSATLRHAFEPFFTTKQSARGLGLSAAFGIVKSHEGYLHAESALGAGTLFDVYLPASGAVLRPPAPVPNQMPRGMERLLIVDDEPALRSVMRRLLERLGYTVDLASSGEEALAAVRRDPRGYALVILDLRLASMPGGEVFDRLRALVPGQRILLATGFERDEEAQRLLDAGAVGFLQKPFGQGRLAIEVRRALDG